MATTANWSPNQALTAQVETYTFTVPNGPGNWYVATINGKSLTYVSVIGDTAATVATAVAAMLAAVAGTGSGPAELAEISFANPFAGVVTATALVPGTPFANVTIRGVAGQGGEHVAEARLVEPPRLRRAAIVEEDADHVADQNQQGQGNRCGDQARGDQIFHRVGRKRGQGVDLLRHPHGA